MFPIGMMMKKKNNEVVIPDVFGFNIEMQNYDVLNNGSYYSCILKFFEATINFSVNSAMGQLIIYIKDSLNNIVLSDVIGGIAVRNFKIIYYSSGINQGKIGVYLYNGSSWTERIIGTVDIGITNQLYFDQLYPFYTGQAEYSNPSSLYIKTMSIINHDFSTQYPLSYLFNEDFTSMSVDTNKWYLDSFGTGGTINFNSPGISFINTPNGNYSGLRQKNVISV